MAINGLGPTASKLDPEIAAPKPASGRPFILISENKSSHFQDIVNQNLLLPRTQLSASANNALTNILNTASKENRGDVESLRFIVNQLENLVKSPSIKPSDAHFLQGYAKNLATLADAASIVRHAANYGLTIGNLSDQDRATLQTLAKTPLEHRQFSNNPSEGKQLNLDAIEFLALAKVEVDKLAQNQTSSKNGFPPDSVTGFNWNAEAGPDEKVAAFETIVEFITEKYLLPQSSK